MEDVDISSSQTIILRGVVVIISFSPDKVTNLFFVACLQALFLRKSHRDMILVQFEKGKSQW